MKQFVAYRTKIAVNLGLLQRSISAEHINMQSHECKLQMVKSNCKSMTVDCLKVQYVWVLV